MPDVMYTGLNLLSTVFPLYLIPMCQHNGRNYIYSPFARFCGPTTGIEQ